MSSVLQTTRSLVASRFETRARQLLLARYVYVSSIYAGQGILISHCALQITKLIESGIDEAAEGVANLSVTA